MKGLLLTGLVWFFLAWNFSTSGQSAMTLNIRMEQPPGAVMPGRIGGTNLSDSLKLGIDEFESRIEHLIGQFENAGYPFIQIGLDSVLYSSTGFSGILRVNPGQLVTYDTIKNRTEFRISQAVLYRLLDIRPGDIYRESKLSKAALRLNRLPFINQSRPIEVGFHASSASVYVYPVKAAANRFDGWIGLSPDTRSSGQLSFSGSLQLSLDNLFRQGEHWNLNWNRNQDASQKLRLVGHFPYLSGLPFGLGGEFGLYRQDTTYVTVDWEIGVPYHFSPDHQISFFFRKRESSVLIPITDQTRTGNKPFESLITGLSWGMNELDSKLNPFRGLAFSLEAVTGRKVVQDTTNFQQSEFLATITWFQPLAKKLTMGFLVHSGYRLTANSLLNEQYRLGGLNYLRGFDEDEFRTDAFAVGSLELRYLLDPGSHLVLLADLAALRGMKDGQPDTLSPAGFGLGGQVRTEGGVFRIIFALGKQSNQPVTLQNAKIHLGYVAVF